jgi:anti-sigma factor RsiW
MSISDPDIELLEAHLDGELSATADDALRHRLESDHELASELIALRAARSVRTQLFDSLEPDDLTLGRLITGVRKQITKETIHGPDVWGDRLRILRYISSAAAVIMISFTAGWLGRSHTTGVDQAAPSAETVAKRDDANSNDPSANAPIVATDVMNKIAPKQAAQNPAGYQVNLTDAFGHVIAVQHFNTLDEAREFSEDVTHWQRQQQQQTPVAEPVVYKDQF